MCMRIRYVMYVLLFRSLSISQVNGELNFNKENSNKDFDSEHFCHLNHMKVTTWIQQL